MTPGVPLPTDEAHSCEELSKCLSSLAEMPINFDEMPLPEMPLDDMFSTGWPVLEEDETTGLYGESSIIVPLSDSSLFTGAEQSDQPGYTGLRKVDGGQSSVVTCAANHPQKLSVDSAPQSPLLAATDEEECSMASFEDIVGDEKFIRDNSAETEASGNEVRQANDGVETHNPATGSENTPVSPRSSGKDERITVSPLRLIDISDNPQQDSSRIPTPSTSPLKAPYGQVKF